MRASYKMDLELQEFYNKTLATENNTVATRNSDFPVWDDYKSSLRNDGSGLVLHLSCLPKRLAQCLHIMAIHGVSIPPKGFAAILIDVCAVLKGRDSTLPEAVHVEDCHQVVQTVVRRKGQSLPDRAF
ncbi:hypothetical protein GH733_011946 [Mirounga leonina]|nr:hypothetical protein GH733_011946 [Mirounga leonina]